MLKKSHNIHHLKPSLKAEKCFSTWETLKQCVYIFYVRVLVLFVSRTRPSHTAMLCVCYYQSKGPGSGDSDKFLVKADSGHAALCPNHTAPPPHMSPLKNTSLLFLHLCSHFFGFFSPTPLIFIDEGSCSIIHTLSDIFWICTLGHVFEIQRWL